MTNEEAIKIMDYYRWNCNGEVDCYGKCDSCNTALDMAIEALEKQIPKKPHKSKSEYYCPSCPENTCVGKNHYDGHRTRHDFCFNCGQAILWEDDND